MYHVVSACLLVVLGIVGILLPLVGAWFASLRSMRKPGIAMAVLAAAACLTSSARPALG